MKLRTTIACVLAATLIALSAGCKNNDAQSSDGESGSQSTVETTATSGNIGDIELKSGDKIAEFNIDGYGTIKAKLFPDIAPKGVDNFIKLADSGFYDGLTIHRVYAGFMFQGGSLNGDGTGGEAADGGSFGIETSDNARHFYGALCYANAGGQNTCQFYIVNNKSENELTNTINTIKEYREECITERDKYEKDSYEYSYYDSGVAYYDDMLADYEAFPDNVVAKYDKVGGAPSLDGGYTVFGQVYEGFDVIDAISACEVIANAGGEMSLPVKTITITSVKITEYTE
ncbi:MAG: peptidylprolyl isomerase [Ruminococcaceae bacterium]|nr:peptidylprolyl isomerase [Oscillospiraceae bacterium]